MTTAVCLVGEFANYLSHLLWRIFFSGIIRKGALFFHPIIKGCSFFYPVSVFFDCETVNTENIANYEFFPTL